MQLSLLEEYHVPLWSSKFYSAPSSNLHTHFRTARELGELVNLWPHFQMRKLRPRIHKKQIQVIYIIHGRIRSAHNV
jgi:hypothetical protein